MAYNEENIKIELLNESQISQNDNFINFKLIILGDSGVGKSSLLKRAVQNKFDGSYQATLGFEFLLMHFQVNELKIKLQIWDTCGQEMYRSLIQGFYRNTSLAIVVYDIHNKESYDALEIWVKDIKQHTEPDLPIIIIGNKLDLNREVPYEDAKIFATSNRAKYFTECSAKTGQNVNDIFFEASKFLYKAYNNFKSKNMITPASGKLKIGDNNDFLTPKSKGCC